MRLSFKNLSIVVAICMLLAIPMSGCGSSVEKVDLDAFVQETENGAYDSSVFYKNESYLWGGDSGAIYVPEEQDEEYGGWFYQYMSEAGGLASPLMYDNNTYGASVAVFRSKDMNEWELCGAVDNGLGMYFESDSWRQMYTWAPEVIYDAVSQKYMMYFSSASKVNDGSVPGAEYSSNATNLFYRFYLGIAISDTPVGPFTLVTAKDYYGEEKPNLNGDIITDINPPINIQKYFNLSSEWTAIDCTPFVDTDGTMYLYFSRHHSPNYTGDQNIWCMRMKDYISPDYESLRKVTDTSGVSVEYIGGPVYDDSSYRVITQYNGKEVETDEGAVNEAPQVIVHTSPSGVKKYYMLYAPHGVSYWAYNANVAVADDPQGPWTKIPEEYGGVALGVDPTNDFMTTLGHIDLVSAGDETRVIHWQSRSPYSTDVDPGRIYATASMSWRFDETLGYDMPYVNGPTISLQPLPQVTTGYKNIAPEATVKAKGTDAKYLNDGWFVTLPYVENCEYKQSEKMEITLSFEDYRSVRAILIYNSYHYEYAFAKVDKVVLHAREDGKDIDYILSDLPFAQSNYSAEGEFMRIGGSSFASFNEIQVKSIDITITQKLNPSAGKEIRVSDVVVLGK